MVLPLAQGESGVWAGVLLFGLAIGLFFPASSSLATLEATPDRRGAVLGAINAAGWTSVQGVPLPLLLVCEDNGIGISTKTPTGWVKASLEHRPGLKYFAADGLDIFACYDVALAAAEYVRRWRKPAVLHLRTVRLYGHAGADMPTTYLPPTQPPDTLSGRAIWRAVARSPYRATQV